MAYHTIVNTSIKDSVFNSFFLSAVTFHSPCVNELERHAKAKRKFLVAQTFF